ncbi:MAG: hypothetical protein Ct9H300mP30_4820 [Methanobacteriota archaeon]|nr:MAG: hypothetical protein Ct9H300mP30_4820 [Euryarchaeota archaeon]
MVTLRKISLTLADHHVGVTHAGDGRSRLITDFDRAAAIEMGEKFEAERKAQTQTKADRQAMSELPKPQRDMPRTPDPLGTPKSLGGLAERAGAEIETSEVEDGVEAEGGTIDSLRDRPRTGPRTWASARRSNRSSQNRRKTRSTPRPSRRRLNDGGVRRQGTA